ncbi:MAG: nucleotidyltransferase domain-containing protein [Thermoanaerobaculia bacterium]|nr:nucleotidyltransferase domain-containing protein [Thermoanaerobaculia bacterium]
MQAGVEQRQSEIAALCRRFGVRRLELFGSAARADFDPTASDVDLLVEPEPPPGLGYADAYFGLKEELERLFGRPVDLVSLASLRNPYFIREIEASRRLLYAA